jgi:uncharacterized protein (TIGR03437 family)
VVSCTIESEGDNDSFRFNASEGDPIFLLVSAQSGGALPCVQLWGPDGAKNVERCGAFGGNVVPSRGWAQINVTVELEGIHTAIVNAFRFGSSMDYSLALLRLSPPSPGSGRIQSGETLQGQRIDLVGDVDQFTFHGAADDTVILTSTREEGPGLPTILLFDPVGDMLAEDSGVFGGNVVPDRGFAKIEQHLGKTGAYSVLALESGNNQTLTYALDLQCIGTCVIPAQITAVVDAAAFAPSVSAGSWISVFGSGLAEVTRSWQEEDFVGSALPTRLGGTEVIINGRKAVIAYVNPRQINALVPWGTEIGTVDVQVIAPRSNTVPQQSLEVRAAAPALFAYATASGSHVAAVHANGDLVGPLARFGTSGVIRPAKFGDILSIYASGMGPTIPPAPEAQQIIEPLPLADANTLQVVIAGMSAEVDFAGLVAPGLYQINIEIPAVPPGDQLISVAIGGATSQENVVIRTEWAQGRMRWPNVLGAGD